VVLAVLGLGFGCGGGGSGGSGSEADTGGGAAPLKVGFILPLTGPQAKFGEIEKWSAELAAEEINAAGGVGGRRLELLIEDDMGKPEVGRAAAEKLISVDRVLLLAGGYSSSVTYAVAGVAVNRGFPFLVNTGSADKITEPAAFTPAGRKLEQLRKRLESARLTQEGLAELEAQIARLEEQARAQAAALRDRFAIFRINPPVSEYASGIESFLAEVVRPKTAAILHEHSLFGTKGAAAFARICDRLGIEIVLNEGYEAGAVDFRPLLGNVKALDPDIIYMVSYVMDASLLINQSMELRMSPRLFIGGAAGFTLPEFIQNTGRAGEKVVSATLWHESLKIPGAREYFEKFRKRYSKAPDYHGAEAYAAVQVIADALGRARSLDPEGIREALAATELTTVFGPVKFESYGEKINQNRAPTYVVQWQDGELRLVWPREVAAAPYVYPVDWAAERGATE
jgi:branched-chain amino acid transport system substrate-binding protein